MTRPHGIPRSMASHRILSAALILSMSCGQGQAGGGLTGGATEWTQILNNGELVHLVGQSSQQINNQITQISQLAEQIQNQLRIYQNMLQNTAQLPAHVWGEVQGDLNQLRSIVNQGQGIAFSMGMIQPHPSAAEFTLQYDISN